MPSQLLEFLEERKVKAQGVDWKAKKLDWLQAVAALYDSVKGMLSGSIQSGAVSLNEVEVQVSEDFVGTYGVSELHLTVGDDRVVFVPIGITVVGACGRVDVRGDRETVSLLWMNPGDWRVVEQRTPKLILSPLTEESLLELFQRIMAP